MVNNLDYIYNTLRYLIDIKSYHTFVFFIKYIEIIKREINDFILYLLYKYQGNEISSFNKETPVFRYLTSPVYFDQLVLKSNNMVIIHL